MNSRSEHPAPTVVADEKQWYVMRFLYNDHPKLRALIAASGIETFTPMKWVVKTDRTGRRVKEQVPVLRDLYFVHATHTDIDPYVAAHPTFQYCYKRGGRYREPMVVPEADMTRFIAAVQSSASPLYFTPGELDIARGTRIRLIGGSLHGMTGILLKVKGARSRRLIVELPQTICAAVEVNPDLIEVLPSA